MPYRSGPINVRSTAEKWIRYYSDNTARAIDRGDPIEAGRQAKNAVQCIRKGIAQEYIMATQARQWKAEQVARLIAYDLNF